MTNKQHRPHRPRLSSDKAKPSRRGMTEALKDLNELGYLPSLEPTCKVGSDDEIERREQNNPRRLPDLP